MAADKFWYRKESQNNEIVINRSDTYQETGSSSDNSGIIREFSIDPFQGNLSSLPYETSIKLELIEDQEDSNKLRNRSENSSDLPNSEENKVIQQENNDTGHLEALINQPRSFSDKMFISHQNKKFSIGINDLANEYGYFSFSILVKIRIITDFMRPVMKPIKSNFSSLLKNPVNTGFIKLGFYGNMEDNHLKTIDSPSNEIVGVTRMIEIEEIFNIFGNYLNKSSREGSIKTAELCLQSFNEISKVLKLQICNISTGRWRILVLKFLKQIDGLIIICPLLQEWFKNEEALIRSDEELKIQNFELLNLEKFYQIVKDLKEFNEKGVSSSKKLDALFPNGKINKALLLLTFYWSNIFYLHI